MDRILIPWSTGNGNIVLERINSKKGITLNISSDTVNEGEQRSQVITFTTSTGNVKRTITVTQKGNKVVMK